MAAKYNEDASDELRAEQAKLNCPICLETYKDPKLLSCLHTLCEPCINSHVTEMKTSGTLKDGIECQLCKKITVAKKKDILSDGWAKSLSSNYAILSLIEVKSLKGGEGQTKGIHCQPCKKRDNSEKAEKFCPECQEYLCSSCVNIHGTFSFTEGHELMEIEDMATNLSQIDFCRSMTGLDRCETHSKQIEFYCVDDKQLCCSSCAIITHRTCKNVVEIDQIAEKKDEQDMETLKTNLKTIKDKLRKPANHFRKSEKGIDDQVATIKETIQTVRAELNKKIDEFEKKILNETATIQKQKSCELNECRVKCQSLIAAIGGSLCTQEAVSQHGSASQKFIATHKLNDQLTSYESSIEESFSTLKSVEISLKLDKQLQRIMEPSFELGTIVVKSSTPTPDVKPVELELVASVDIKKAEQDSREPLYTGMDYLADGRLVAVDNKNDKCLIINEKLDIVGTNKLKNKPLGVVSPSDNKLYITSGKQIDVFDVNKDNTLTSIQTITTTYKCFSISVYDDNHFAVGNYDQDIPACIVSKTGEEQQFNVDFPSKVYGINDSQCAYMKAENKLILTIEDEHGVYIYDTKDKIKVMIKDNRIKKPREIAACQSGCFFVCSNETNSIVQISTAGTVMSTHKLVSMWYPYSICLSRDQTKLAVSNNAIGDTKLQIFKLSTK